MHFHFEYIYNDLSTPKPNGNPIETSENNHTMRELKPATIFVPCYLIKFHASVFTINNINSIKQH